jgi:lincosamide nucleotidyltransferase A/C/D/E
MSSSYLIELLDHLDKAAIAVWLDGGWGVDALLGRQTRPHRDADIIVAVADVPKLQDVLGRRGFAVKEGTVPNSFVLSNTEGLEVDVHAVVFDNDGNGVYTMRNGEDWIYPAEGFRGKGRVEGRSVSCLSATTQVLCHTYGYTPSEQDFCDMKLLQERFGIELPPRLRRNQEERCKKSNNPGEPL